MREKLTNDLGLKLISLFLAFIVWLFVTNVSNPEVTRSQEVELEVLNADVLSSAGQVYELGRKTVSVSYDVHTMDENRIKAANFKATVDMSELYDVTGSIQVKVECTDNEAAQMVKNISARPSVVRVQTEELQTKEFEIRASVLGQPADGYSVGGVELERDTITLSGPVSRVGMISSVGVEIYADQSAENISGSADVLYYDANGNRIDLDEYVTADVSEINYTVLVQRVRSMSLRVQTNGTPAEGYGYAGYECSEQTVDVCGQNEALAATSYITIPAELLDISGATANITVEVDLTQCLPEGLSLASGQSRTASVELKIEELAKKTVYILENGIYMSGMDSKKTYHISPARVPVVLSGVQDVISGAGSGDVNATLDVSQYTEAGSYEVELSVELGEGLDLDKAVTVTLQVSDREVGPGIFPGDLPELPAAAETGQGTEAQGSEDQTEESDLQAETSAGA